MAAPDENGAFNYFFFVKVAASHGVKKYDDCKYCKAYTNTLKGHVGHISFGGESDPSVPI